MGNHISKQNRQKIASEKLKKELAIKNAFKRAAKLNGSFVNIIKEVEVGNIDWQNERMMCVANFVKYNQLKIKKRVLNQWIENLIFLTQNLEEKCPSWFKDTDYLKALIELGKYKNAWIRPLEDWKPKAKGDYERFKELIEYLFAAYKFPAFLSHIFFHEVDHFFIKDFIFLAQGGSIKHIFSTIPLTQKMRVEFMKSPEGFRIFEAFRYAQVKALGGDDDLAYRLAYSWLGRRDERNEEFWEHFVRILISGGMFNHDKIIELIDYVRRQLAENWAYTLKGRTLMSLIRQSDEWHSQMAGIKQVNGAVVWPSVDFKSFEVVEGKDFNAVTYRMVELLSNKELIDEGNKMHHCVGSYSQYCAKGRTRIVSLRKFNIVGEVERLATIEVDLNSKLIAQAKYRYNKFIGDKALKMVQEWACLQGFIVRKYL